MKYTHFFTSPQLLEALFKHKVDLYCTFVAKKQKHKDVMIIRPKILRRWLAALSVVANMPVTAQNDAPKVDVSFNVRADFSIENSKTEPSDAGFHGRFLNLMIKGELTPQLSYNFRQRLNKFTPQDNDVFSATDWVYLTYKPTKNWALSGGKQIVAVGGYEYDAAPIDIYYSSLFWQNIACYQFGVSGTYISNCGKHSLMAQMCNSPYTEIGRKSFAFNLMWSGNMGKWHTLWSANFMDCGNGHFGEFVTLGNRFDLGPVTFDLDLMARQYEHSKLLDNFSVISKADYHINATTSIFVKGGYERFNGDMLTTVEAKKPFGSAGIEMRPAKKYPGIRLHAVYGLTTYTGEYQHNAMLGMTWNCNVYKK